MKTALLILTTCLALISLVVAYPFNTTYHLAIHKISIPRRPILSKANSTVPAVPADDGVLAERWMPARKSFRQEYKEVKQANKERDRQEAEEKAQKKRDDKEKERQRKQEEKERKQQEHERQEKERQQQKQAEEKEAQSVEQERERVEQLDHESREQRIRAEQDREKSEPGSHPPAKRLLDSAATMDAPAPAENQDDNHKGSVTAHPTLEKRKKKGKGKKKDDGKPKAPEMPKQFPEVPCISWKCVLLPFINKCKRCPVRSPIHGWTGEGTYMGKFILSGTNEDDFVFLDDGDHVTTVADIKSGKGVRKLGKMPIGYWGLPVP